MRAILRRGVYMAAAAASRRSSPNLAGPSPHHRLSNLVRHLRQYKPPPPSDDGDADDVDERGKLFSHVPGPDRTVPKSAAVLICLFEDDDGELRVILTQRSSALSTHSGEVALPGGKAEDGDADDAVTATREAKEEIGLNPSLVTIITVLEPFLSKHLLRVVPVVGILSDKRAFEPVLNADEVEAIFDAPLEMFLKDENRRWEEREWLGTKFTVHYFDYVTGNSKVFANSDISVQSTCAHANALVLTIRDADCNSCTTMTDLLWHQPISANLTLNVDADVILGSALWECYSEMKRLLS